MNTKKSQILPHRSRSISYCHSVVLWLMSFVLVVFWSQIVHPGALQSSRVTEVRHARLARGINLPGWMWLNRGQVGEIQHRYPKRDFELIRSLGFTHVRVPIDMANVYEPEEKDLLNRNALAYLDRAIEEILRLRLAVIVDLHSISQKEGGSNYSGPLGQDEEFTGTFVRFWGSFAEHLSKHDPGWVILEPMNEPVFRKQEEKWPRIQEKVIAEIRKNAPRHTIIATGARWSNISTLLDLTPLEDTNIIYNFHFYEPHIFTHQGATWSSNLVKPLREVPYPSSPEAVKHSMELVESKQAKDALRLYGEKKWNAVRIGNAIGKVADWARQHGVRVICDEFGAYRRYCLPRYRVPWLRDVRTAFEEYGFGWAMWNYDGGFGLVHRENGKAVVDREVAKALGLNEGTD